MVRLSAGTEGQGACLFGSVMVNELFHSLLSLTPMRQRGQNLDLFVYYPPTMTWILYRVLMFNIKLSSRLQEVSHCPRGLSGYSC